jgi:superkiller protein 3
MGNAYYSFGLAENATREYRIAVGMDPSLSDAWNNLGLSLTMQSQYEEAKSALENATRLNPDDPEGWYNLGYTFGMLGRNDEELAAYEKALNLQPNMTIAWRNTGVVRFEQGNYTGAAEALEQAVSTDPSSAIGWYYLGTAYEKTGNLTGAASVLNKALQLDQNLTMAKDKLSAVEKNLTAGSYPSSILSESPVATLLPDKKTPVHTITILFSLIAIICCISARR